MITVSETTVLDHSPERVFEAAADPNKQLEWDAGTLKSVEKLNPGPLAEGARYRGKFKGFGTEEYEYEDYEPPRRFTHRAKMAMGTMRHTFTIEAAGQGTRLTQEGRLEPNLFGRLGAPMIKGMLRKRFRLIADELTEYLGKPPSTAG